MLSSTESPCNYTASVRLMMKSEEAEEALKASTWTSCVLLRKRADKASEFPSKARLANLVPTLIILVTSNRAR